MTQTKSFNEILSSFTLSSLCSPQCNVLYGQQMATYKTLGDSLVTLVKLQLGIFNYDEVRLSSATLTSLLIQRVTPVLHLCYTCLLRPTPGVGLQPCPRGRPHRLLRHLHDFCGSESADLCGPRGVQTRAAPSQGTEHGEHLFV